MPVFRQGPAQAPAWCELTQFEIVRLAPGDDHRFERQAVREKLIAGDGACRIATGAEGGPVAVSAQAVTAGANLDLAGEGVFRADRVTEPTTLIRMCGRWGDQLGGSGLFTCANVDGRCDKGDPVDYAKRTSFDSHYHDCDEYWILFQGRGVAVSEGRHYDVGPGDCVATGMGHHHDLPLVHEPIRAVYFETTMEGERRRGHLWDHTHGPAQPRRERV